MKLIQKITLIYLVITSIFNSSFATTIYIDQATGDDLNDGLTPLTAVATITQGKALSTVGDTLDIGSGTYSESLGENYPLIFESDINLQGAGPGLTFLDGELNTRLIWLRGTTSVFNIGGLSVINSDDSGMRADDIAQLNLSDCGFENNLDNSSGGAITLFDTFETNIINCHFEGNEASTGGAIKVQINDDNDVLMNITQSSFVNNDASIGSAIRFQENGAGVHTLNVNQSQFINNDGSNIDFQANGGTSKSMIVNSVFSGGDDTAIFADSTDLDVINSTFVGNREAIRAGAGATIVNSIFWDNVFQLRGAGGGVSFSIVEDLDLDGHIDAGNNMDIDPLLDGNFRLTDNSPAIDMGSDQAVDDFGLTQDIDLEPRKVNFLGLIQPNNVVDIGADEKLDLIFADGFE